MRQRDEKLSIVFNPSWNDWTPESICKIDISKKASFIYYNVGEGFFSQKEKVPFVHSNAMAMGQLGNWSY